MTWNLYADDMDNPFDLEEEDLIVQAAATAAIATALSVIDYSQTYFLKTPYHNPTLTGTTWVAELLTGHSKHVHHELGVHKHVFQALIVALQDAGYTVTVMDTDSL